LFVQKGLLRARTVDEENNLFNFEPHIPLSDYQHFYISANIYSYIIIETRNVNILSFNHFSIYISNYAQKWPYAIKDINSFFL